MCKILITSREGTEREPYWGFALPPVWLRHNANQGLFLEKQTGSHGNDHVPHPHPYHFLNHRESYDTLTALRPPPLSRPTPPIICSMWNVDGMLVRQEGSKTPSGRGGAQTPSPSPPRRTTPLPPCPSYFSNRKMSECSLRPRPHPDKCLWPIIGSKVCDALCHFFATLRKLFDALGIFVFYNDRAFHIIIFICMSDCCGVLEEVIFFFAITSSWLPPLPFYMKSITPYSGFPEPIFHALDTMDAWSFDRKVQKHQVVGGGGRGGPRSPPLPSSTGGWSNHTPFLPAHPIFFEPKNASKVKPNPRKPALRATQALS